MSNCSPVLRFKFNTIAINVSEHVNYFLSSHRFLIPSKSLTQTHTHTHMYTRFNMKFIFMFSQPQRKNDDATVAWSDGVGNDCHNADADPDIHSLHVHAETLTVVVL